MFAKVIVDSSYFVSCYDNFTIQEKSTFAKSTICANSNYVGIIFLRICWCGFFFGIFKNISYSNYKSLKHKYENG